MFGFVLCAALTVGLYVFGIRMWRFPESGIPGYTWGSIPSPDRTRRLGKAITAAAVLATGFLPFVWFGASPS